VQAVARAHTVEAIQTLVRALNDEKLCVSAAAHLLDRGWGKPVAPMELDGTKTRVTAITLNIVSTGDQPQLSNGLDPPGVITITADDD
jgi:hypothetical protein